MQDSEKIIVVRELYPEIKRSLLGKAKKCPDVDDIHEFAYGMTKDGVVRLPDKKARDNAAQRGDRIFAIYKNPVDLSNVIPKICNEDGYEWNYSIRGKIRVSDPSKFLLVWGHDEGACGIDGIDADYFANRIMDSIGPIIRDEINKCRIERGYRIRNIEEKDALPSSFWNQILAQTPISLLDGVSIEIVEKSFLSPDLEMESKRAAATEAQRKVEEQARNEQQAAINRMRGEAEMDDIERRKQLAELDFEQEKAKKKLDFEYEKAKKELEIRKCQMEAEASQFQMANLKKDKEEIAAALEKAKGNAEQMAALKDALVEAVAKMAVISDKLAKLGVMTDGTSDCGSNIDPAVAPRYQGMSDKFLDVMAQIKSKSKNSVTLTYQVRDSYCGFATRAIISDAYTARTLGAIGGNCVQARAGTLHINDGITIRMTSERTGYLTLINFGTTPGVVNKIFPDRMYEERTRLVETGRHYVMPGDLIRCPDGREYWPIGGATTAQHGLKERVLAIVTDKRVDIDEKDLASAINGALSKGNFNLVEDSLSSYMEQLNQTDGTWSWGLLEAVVEE